MGRLPKIKWSESVAMRNRGTGARGWRHTDIHEVVGVRIDITTKTLGGVVKRHGRISLANRQLFFPNLFIIFRAALLFCVLAAPHLTRILLVD